MSVVSTYLAPSTTALAHSTAASAHSPTGNEMETVQEWSAVLSAADDELSLEMLKTQSLALEQFNKARTSCMEMEAENHKLQAAVVAAQGRLRETDAVCAAEEEALNSQIVRLEQELQEIAFQKGSLQSKTEQELQTIKTRKEAALAALDQSGKDYYQASLKQGEALSEAARSKLRALIRPLKGKLQQAKDQLQKIMNAEKAKIKALESSNPSWAAALRGNHNFEGHEQWELDYAFRYLSEIDKL